MSITNKTTKQETLIRKDELNKNTFKVTVNTDDINILTTTNGITTFTSENYIDGIQLITQVPEPKLQTKVVNITQNGSYTIKPDDDLDALESVIVGTNVPQYKIDSIKIYNNGYKLATVAPDTLYLTETTTDIKDLIPELGIIYKIKNNTNGLAYFYASDAVEYYQYITFTYEYSFQEIESSELERISNSSVLGGVTFYILKLASNVNYPATVAFCNGTTLENAITLFTYYSKVVTTVTTKEYDHVLTINKIITSENFPIKF
ncbi:hypothetical protein ENUP19_0332G0024 [Entamoeba nuttalli]|uniref:Uncharacterized protein n=1 Tax=Entamoeba nuttalli TaxID=412467 RepID=A0ABQ0DX52_9EUKA